MNDSDSNKILVGIVIGLLIFALAAWASGAGKPKYNSRAEYEVAVQAGEEPPPDLLDAQPDYDYGMGRP